MGVREHLRRFKDYEAQVCRPAYYSPLTRCRRYYGGAGEVYLLLTTHYSLLTTHYSLATYYLRLPRWRRRRGR